MNISKGTNHSMIDRAIKLAVKAHAQQLRKDGTPYISHPMTVGFMLARQGFNEATVVAGILHDVVEDTPVTIETVEKEFGPAVAEMVAAVSEPQDLPWKEQKRQRIAQIQRGSDSIKAIAAADRISNLQDFLEEYEKVGPPLWDRWPERTPQEKLAYDEQFLAMLRSTWDHPLIDEIEQLIQQEKRIVQDLPK